MIDVRKVTNFKETLESIQNKIQEAEKLDRYDIATQHLINQLAVIRLNASRFMALPRSFYSDVLSIQTHLRKNYFKIRYNNHIDPKRDIFYRKGKLQVEKIFKRFWF